MDKKRIFFISFSIYVCTILKPIYLVESMHPILLYIDNKDYHYLFTSGKSLKISKESGIVIEAAKFMNYGDKYISIHDNSYNNYLYIENTNEYYYIDSEPFCSYNKTKMVSMPSIKMEDIIKEGSIALDNDFIIYGKSTDGHLFFLCGLKGGICYKQIEKSISSLSCKYIKDNEYICVMIINSRLRIVLLEVNSLYQVKEICSPEIILDIKDNSFNEKIALFDTDINNIKILCGKKETYVKCQIYKIENPKDYEMGIILIESTKILFKSRDLSENDCCLTVFNFEYLFCCGEKNFISCFRMNHDNFEIIKEFRIVSLGNNKNLSIKNDKNFVSFFS